MDTQGLLLAVYFARAAGLLLLISFFAVAGWPERIGMAAVWFVPDALVFFRRPDLRGYLPGLLLFGFGLIFGMIPGVLAEMAAERAGATPEVAKGAFVVVGAAATAAIMRLAYRQAAGPGSPDAEPGAAPDRRGM